MSENLKEVMYINSKTGEIRTKADMISAGWLELGEEYKDKYEFPALYSMAPLHQVLDMSEGDEVGNWRVASSSDLEGIDLSDLGYEYIFIPSTKKEYKLIHDSVIWFEAVKGAINHGGKLAQFETEEEAKNFWDVLTSDEDFFEDLDGENNDIPSASIGGGGAKYLWLGAGDAVEEGTWLWNEDLNNGVVLSLKNPRWGDGEGWTSKEMGSEPDNFKGSQHSLALALEDWPKNSDDSELLGIAGQWNDLDGIQNKLFYLVEMPNDDDENITTTVNTPPSTASQNDSESGEVTYYNTTTHETKTLEQMLADGWVELKEEKYADKYEYPAIYSAGAISTAEGAPIHEALDMSEGDQVGDWIVMASKDGHGDGHGEPKQDVTEPYQTISAASEEITFSPGDNVSFDLLYTTSDSQNELSGLGLKVHYDSSIFTPSGDNEGVTTSLNTLGISTSDDTDNLDNDTNTDKYISISWVDFMGKFPSADLPATIANLNFSSSKEGLDELTGQSKESKINFTSADTATNYDFLNQSVVLSPQTFNLDVDGNGKVTALGDGLMVIRKLFGSAFDGAKLTDKAISTDATKDHQGCHDYIESLMISDMA